MNVCVCVCACLSEKKVTFAESAMSHLVKKITSDWLEIRQKAKKVRVIDSVCKSDS